MYISIAEWSWLQGLQRMAHGLQHIHLVETKPLPWKTTMTATATMPDAANACDTWNVLTHNGCVTITNPATGNHRTFQVRTQSADANFAPGRRIVSLLTGPCNEGDYQGFGFVNDTGIYVWGRHQRTIYERYADMLTRRGHYEAMGAVYQIEGRCRRCNRKLTDPESIALGIGPVCRNEAEGF